MKKYKLLQSIAADGIMILFFVMFFVGSVSVVMAKSENSGQGNSKSTSGKVQKVEKNTVTVTEKHQGGNSGESSATSENKNKGKGNVKQEATSSAGESTSSAIVDAGTKIYGKGKKLLALGGIKPNDKIAIISTDSAKFSTSSGNLKKALRIYIKSASDSASSKRHAIMGVITGISGTTITLSHPIHKDRVSTLETNAATVVKVKSVRTASIAGLQVGQRITAVGDLDANGKIVAKLIHVIPGKSKSGVPNASGSAQPSASSSAQPTASSSATPIASASATPTASAVPTASASATPEL